MFVAIKCSHCGLWQGRQPQNIRKHTFMCNSSFKGGKIWVDDGDLSGGRFVFTLPFTSIIGTDFHI